MPHRSGKRPVNIPSSLPLSKTGSEREKKITPAGGYGVTARLQRLSRRKGGRHLYRLVGLSI